LIETSQLQTLVAVARAKSFSKAADDLSVTQSAISQSIKNLENKIEVNTMARVIRKKKMIWIWKIESLKQWTLEVKEVEGPTECWIKFVSNIIIENWDELEIYKTEIQK